jgi:hypothetical protein
MPVNKVTWQKVDQVKEPGRHNYAFGWLTITPADLAICEQFPAASFTLVPHHGSDDEHRLGAFELLPPPAFELEPRD